MVVINTGADALLDYVQQHGEVTLREAAQALDQPEGTVEAWARFLEEEGLLKFRYSLTQVSLIATKRSATQMAESTIAAQGETMSAAARETTENLGKLIEQARTAMRERDLGKAATAYGQIQRLCAKVGPEEAAAAKPLLDQLAAFSAQFAGTAETMIAQILKSVTAKVAAKDAIGARLLFDQANALANWIPPREQQRRLALQVQLIGVQKTLIAKEFEHYARTFREIAAAIDKMMAQTEQALAKRDLARANAVYADIIRSKDRMPSGFLAQQLQIEKRMFQLYERLSDANLSAATLDFDSKSQRIEQQLSMARDYASQRRADEALAAYEQARQTYSQLPDGFSERTLAIEQNLLEVSRSCLALHGEAVQQRASTILKTAEELLTKTRDAIRAGDLNTARGLSNELSKLYNSFPSELAEERARFESTLRTIRQMLEASGA